MLRLFVYIIYCFILYATYCFSIACLNCDKKLMFSTTAILRLIFYLKTSILISCDIVIHHTLDFKNVTLYSIDTLAVFIITGYVINYLKLEYIFDNQE